MNEILEVLNHPANAFCNGKKAISWSIVGITILLNSVFEPILQHFFSTMSPAIDGIKMLKISILGVLSYLAICAAFWFICKLFGSKTTFKMHLVSWGNSYVPTAICSVVVAIMEVQFYVIWDNPICGMLLNFVFVGILLWKVMLYVIYLKEFASLKGYKLIGAGIVLGIIILLFAAFSGYLGIKTPII